MAPPPLTYSSVGITPALRTVTRMEEVRSSGGLDEVARLRILAATLNCTFVEREVPFRPAEVWTLAADLENELPTLIPHFRKVRVVEPRAERVRVDIDGYLGARGSFTATIEPNLWVMQGKRAVGGMAVTATPGGTRVAFLGMVRMPGYNAVRPLLKPLMVWQSKLVLARLERRCRRAAELAPR
jgi:hypothetical protein